jgi:hypothetical protein
LIVTGEGVGVVELPLLLLFPHETNNIHATTSKIKVRGKCFMIDSSKKIIDSAIHEEWNSAPTTYQYQREFTLAELCS